MSNKSVPLIRNKQVSGVGSDAWTRVVNAAPLNAQVTSAWFPMQTGNTLYIKYSLTRVAGTGNGTWTLEATDDGGTTVFNLTTNSTSVGAITPNPVTVIIASGATVRNMMVLPQTNMPPTVMVRLRMGSAVASAGSTDLITMHFASAAN